MVHDYLVQLGGAERALLELARLYPTAPIYTSLYDRSALGGAFDHIDVRSSWLRRIPLGSRNFRALLPLYPAAFEAFDLSSYDLVISSTTAFAKGVRVNMPTVHVSYMHTPPRFLWYPKDSTYFAAPKLTRPVVAALLPALRRWDVRAAYRPHRIIASSANAAARIRAIYGRHSDVVFPPVDTQAFGPSAGAGDYYLIAARLLRYKAVEIAIAACNELRLPLKIMGSGPDERRLRGLAGGTVDFVGRVDDAQRRRLFAAARALIVPGIEDFGLVPLEAAASGRPTIAFAGGGALETVIEGQTGVFFHEPSGASLAAALRGFSPAAFDADRLVAHSRQFAPELFRERMAALVERYLRELKT